MNGITELSVHRLRVHVYPDCVCVGMQPLSTQLHMLLPPGWRLGLSVDGWRRDRRDRREGGRAEGWIGQHTPELRSWCRAGRGGSLVSKGQRSRKGKTEEGGGDVDVDTKRGVISHVVCALNTLTTKTEIIR